MGKWNDVLFDADCLDNNGAMTNSLLLFKWKAMVHIEITKIRDLAQNTMNMNSINNLEHVEFVNTIGTEKIHRLIKGKSKSHLCLKRLHKNHDDRLYQSTDDDNFTSKA
ncbi:unnamed protein product [Rotaria magnacalcarata]|uniref:Uncharacterized protein n=2 Tax=Rotaria magnacalcarata TaxID=392030 RepID=A0A816QYR3_9BILA|nr:unnamed protein product [Rotaria magnacalcarata]CAF2156166.1 unnamed protein product [Rotaria magnacalcarata]